MKIDSDWSQQLLEEMQEVGASLHLKYAPVVNRYASVVVGFEKRRLGADQALLFENTSLQRDKMELLRRLEQLKTENERFEYSLERQLQKINELEREAEVKDRLLLENSGLIASLQLSNSDYVALLERREGELAQVEKDKESIMEKFEAKSGDYNILLANYMKDKNYLAEKVNQMNELEYSLLEKEKELKAEQFYLAKQWEEFQEKSKKPQPTTPTPPKEKSRIFGRNIEKEPEQEESKETTKKVDSGQQILRNPLKKIVKYHQSEVYDLSFNYSGNLLASCGGDRYIRVLDVHNLRPAASIFSNSAENIFLSVALNYGGERLLAGSTDKTVSIYQTESGKQLHSFPGHGDKVNSVTWSSSKDKMISGSDDKQMKVWDVEKANVLLSVGCGKGVKVVRSNNVQPVVYTGHSDGSVRVYSITQGNSPVSQVRGIMDYPITSLSLMSNRHHIAVTSQEGSVIHILDLKMNKSIAKFEHRDFYNSSTHCALSPSETFLLAGNCDGSIYYWNRYSGEFQRKVSGHDAAATALTYSFMNSVLASADKEGSLVLWQ